MDHSPVIKQVKPSIALVLAVLDPAQKLFSTGSGFVFGTKNILVTCNHVVKDASAVAIKFPDTNAAITSKVIIKDEEHDLALLKFDDSTRNPLPISLINPVTEGLRVIFSGYPFSSEHLTTHQGIISAIIKDAAGITTYAIDGTVNSGNSGCPLMDTEGKVLGVVNLKRRQHNRLLEAIENMSVGALSLHGIDIVEIYKALVSNVNLGMGYAVPANYIPDHKIITP
ncbi:MAG: trypsin-like peptidase domain-containing protein [Candidatus Omnitrophica bacterium]|nr:trypsin-like peptidase domain-containing protein [Candidatus Omnitrophota bacterium]